MRHLTTNALVRKRISRQAKLLNALEAEGVRPRLAIVRDQAGAERRDIRSYTAALNRHIKLVAAAMERTQDPARAAAVGRRYLTVATLQETQLAAHVSALNDSEKVTKILPMSPTAGDFETFAAAVHPSKDVDAMNPASIADGRRPATPRAVRETLSACGLWDPDMRYALIGRGRTVGKYVDQDIHKMQGGAYKQNTWVVTSKTADELPAAMTFADVAIVAAGVRHQIDYKNVHSGLKVIVGVCIEDIAPSAYSKVERLGADTIITPPHNHPEDMGIGALTSAIVWEDVVTAAAAQHAPELLATTPRDVFAK